MTVVEGYPKAPFSIATTLACGEGATPFLGLLQFTLIMLSVKQGGIKYYFLSLWYHSTWDWTPVSWAIVECHYSNSNYLNVIKIWILLKWSWYCPSFMKVVLQHFYFVRETLGVMAKMSDYDQFEHNITLTLGLIFWGNV